MKIILSRKGFDSGYGGQPSPILPDGTAVSFPIPDGDGNCSYDELVFPNGKSYAEILAELSPCRAHAKRCHLDPDIRDGIRKNVPAGFTPGFGQVDAAQSHLENNGVGAGDLFLFFGWFRMTEYSGERLRYAKGAPDLHVIYGYLQVGETLTGEDVGRLPWHPHSDETHITSKNNTIYVPSDRLVIDGKDTGLPGYGTLSYSDTTLLTAEGRSRTQWKYNGIIGTVPVTYHSANNNKDGYFQSACKGQEFVFDEDERATRWAESIITANYRK